MITPLLRKDLQLIADLVPEGADVLDIGCGEGELLHWLATHKAATARGLELDASKVNDCINLGISVVQADAEEELSYFADKSCDMVILSRTLQAMSDPVAVLNHVVRIGKQAIIAIPNFGYWRNRAYLALKGRMPVTQTLRYEWYNTPNIHFCTLRDFIELCGENGITITAHSFHNQAGEVKSYGGAIRLANLLAEQATFLISRD